MQGHKNPLIVSIMEALTFRPDLRRPIMRPAIRCAVVTLLAGVATTGAAQQPMTPADSARHLLNRLGYGPRPGDVEAVTRMGVRGWVDAQLAPRPSEPAPAPWNWALTVPTRTLVQLHASQVAQPTTPPRTNQPDGTPMGKADLRRVNADLASLTVHRAVASSSQVQEVLADFWFNHFNVLATKGFVRAYLRDYVESTIRPRALGSFHDLLLATARSPAMLFYLDNVQSVAEGAGARRRPMARGRMMQDSSAMSRAAARAPRGLNENYARELLELHTLGIDGGYTQADVVEVARILTGWTIARGEGAVGFVFNAAAHDRGAKQVLGITFPAGGGVDEGERLLKILADHPATMHHISQKLCARLVADQAPDGCVDDAVRAWRSSGGDIATVVAAIIRSPDFWATSNVMSKVKSPFEFVVSALRAVGATPDATPRVAAQVGRLGQPLFQQTAPIGYPESLADWVNSGALLARMNFAVALAGGRVAGAAVDLDRLIQPTADHAALVGQVDRVILGGTMTSQTRVTIIREIASAIDARAARDLAVGLAIGGPEFQRQ